MFKKAFLFFKIFIVVFLLVTGFATLRELSRQTTKHPQTDVDEFYQKYTQNIDPKELSLNTYECFLCNHVARLNDQVIYLGKKNFFRQPITAIWSRYLAINVFPLTAAADLVWSGMRGFYHWGNPKSWYYFGKAKKCLYGLLASPYGFALSRFGDAALYPYTAKQDHPTLW